MSTEEFPFEYSPATDVVTCTPTMLKDLLNKSIVLEEEWTALPASVRDNIAREITAERLLAALVEHHLLTGYQASRVGAGRLGGLILGNYRVLERVGAGAMGVVFKAEHLLMRRLAAIKLLPMAIEQ